VALPSLAATRPAARFCHRSHCYAKFRPNLIWIKFVASGWRYGVPRTDVSLRHLENLYGSFMPAKTDASRSLMPQGALDVHLLILSRVRRHGARPRKEETRGLSSCSMSC
jgi:hypothetical protein